MNVSETGIVRDQCVVSIFELSLSYAHFRVVIISHKLSLLRFSRLHRLFCSLAFSLFFLLSLSVAHTLSRTYMCVRVRVRVHVCVCVRVCVHACK